MAEVTLARGLKDVYLDTTESSFIDGEQGILLYRGYNIHDLASKSTFEETSYLLLYGKLPTKSELDAFHKRLVEYRTCRRASSTSSSSCRRPTRWTSCAPPSAPSRRSTPTPRT